jgi:hypothetical protein
VKRYRIAPVGERSTPKGWRAWRVLEPAPGVVLDAPAELVPAPAARMAVKAVAAGAVVRSTYSLCEALDGSGELLSVVVVRVQVPDGDARARGWASWHNAAFNAAQWWPAPAPWPRNVGATEFAALVTGQAYARPAPRPAAPVGPCPRCGSLVRWRIMNEIPCTYAHKKTVQSDENKKGEKVQCL